MKKKLLTLVSTLLLTTLTALPAFSQEKFDDVRVHEQNYESVNTVVNKYKVMTGFSDRTFRGEEPINRYAYSVVLFNTIEVLNNKLLEIEQAKMLDTTPTISNENLKYINIPDLSKNHWAYAKALKLLNLGLVKTYSDNTFRGENNVNHLGFTIGLGRLMTIIVEYAPPVLKRKWDLESSLNAKTIQEIPPSSPIYEPFKLAIDYKLIDYQANKEYLLQDISRYEVAEYLSRLIEKMEELRKYIVFTRIG